MGLVNKLSITCFTDYSFWTFWWVCGDDFFLALCTFSFIELSLITLQKPITMAYVWMFSGERDAIFYIKSEFLFDDFKRFFGDFTE